MFRFVIVVFTVIASLRLPQPQEDISALLSRAEDLYYQARFSDAIQLLLPIDASLRSQPQRVEERLKVKLQLALDYIGLNETPAGRNFFAEMTDLDPSYSLDSRKYSQKVIALFDEVKQEHNATRCQTVCMEGNTFLDIGDTESLLARIRTAGADCVCLQATALDAADHFYQQGLKAYEEENLTEALEDFQVALKFQPEHKLASSYTQLTLDKVRLAVDQLFVKWRQEFETGQFTQAAASFHRLASANVEGTATNTLNQATALYRESLSKIVSSWIQACNKGDEVTMRNARQRAAELLPDPAIARDLLVQIQTCHNKVCLQMPDRLALTRLKTRIDPQIGAAVLPRPTTIQVQVRISEEGSVTVTRTRGGNAAVQSAVKAAVARWQFLPAVIDQEARCVETEIPIIVR